MSEIEERLSDLEIASVEWHTAALGTDSAKIGSWAAQRCEIKAAIVKPWDMAVKAMEAAAALLDALAEHADEHYETGGDVLDAFINDHLSDIDETTTRPLWAALTAMEDSSPSCDESIVKDTQDEYEISDEYFKRVVEDDDHHGKMLEDKRYGRDDIYKK